MHDCLKFIRNDDAMTNLYATIAQAQYKGKKSFITILFLLLIFLQISLWTDEDTFRHWSDMRERNTQLATENLQMRTVNIQLTHEIAALKSGNDMVEALAREELDMIKDDELFFRFVNRAHITDDNGT